jgi:hypothetical protein
LHEVPAQYSDVPLACYCLGALAFALLERPVLAGIFAGFAAWTKNEGTLFLVLLLAAMIVFRRRAVLAAAAGALPAMAIVGFFRLALARGNESVVAASAAGAARRLVELGRFGQIAAGFGHGFLAMAAGWYHPILPLIALAIALRFDRQYRREAAFPGLMVAAWLVSYFGVYLVTPNDLAWQLQTSMYRLLVQIWPSFLLAIFIALRVPQAAVMQAAAAVGDGKRVKKRKRKE